jgi:hypothetical protein
MGWRSLRTVSSPLFISATRWRMVSDLRLFAARVSLHAGNKDRFFC